MIDPHLVNLRRGRAARAAGAAAALAAVASLGAACVEATPPADDRPETFAFVTEAILAPRCGTAECHSAMKAQNGYAFDSVAAARAALDRGRLVVDCAHVTPAPLPSPCLEADQQSYLLTVITDGDVKGNLMPLDQGLSRVDIDLIARWIEDGADGYVVKDAP